MGAAQLAPLPLPSLGPTLAHWRGEAFSAALQPFQFFISFAVVPISLPSWDFQAMMCFYHFPFFAFY